MVYDKKSRSWCHRLTAGVLSLVIALGVMTGLTIPAQAASTGNNNPWGEYTCDPSAAITIPPNTDPNIIARVYPVEYDESINGGGAGAIDVPEDLSSRWMYAGGEGENGADYSLYAHMPGHTLEYQQMFYPRMFIDGGAIKWKYDTKGINGLFITPVRGDNVFLDWLAEGLSVGINTDNPSATSIGVALKDKFYGEIATDEAKGQEFWESYFSVFLGRYPGNDQMVDGWRELLAQNKLSLVVDVNVPMSVKTDKGVQQGYLNITQFLMVHRTIVDKIIGVDYRSEKAYTDAVAGSLACWGSSGGGGSPPCTNLRCINSGHLRFAMGLVTNILVDVIRPDDASNKVTGLPDRYGSWGYFHCGAEMTIPAVQLIEQWQYYDNGVKVHEDEKFRKSYDTLTIFKQSGDADREADETSRWGGDDFTFNEYSYTITEVDTTTGADKEVLDPPGRPESDTPQITVSTNEMQANKAYKIVVIAKYVKESVPLEPVPTRVEEWEFSQFWDSLAQFTETGALKSDEIVVTANLNKCSGHWVPRRKDGGGGYYRYHYPSLSTVTGNYRYNYKFDGADSDYTLTFEPQTYWDTGSKTWSYRGGGNMVTPGQNPDIGIWANKMRIGDELRVAEWMNGVPSVLDTHFEADFFPSDVEIGGYRGKGLGSKVTNSTDKAILGGDSQSASKSSYSEPCSSSITNVKITGGLDYVIQISFHKYNASGSNAYVAAQDGNTTYVSGKTPSDLSLTNLIRFSAQTKDQLIIYPEVDMQYDDKDGDPDGIIAVGEQPRQIKPFTENGQLKSDNIVVTASLNSCTLTGAFFMPKMPV